ncbi:MAG: hypothetical protein ACLFWF_15270 [Alphaproteobacteria bacterium]
MSRHRSVRYPALAAALIFLAAVLVWAPFSAVSQDAADSSEIGTREQKTRDVDWPALKRDEVQRGRMDPQTGALLEAPPVVATVTKEELRKARLPVLLPDDGRMVERMRLFAERDRYVAALREEDYTVQITGTRISQGTLKSEGAADRMRQMSDAEGYVYQRTEYGCELSFTRYNVSYNISVECREPESDPRCTERDYVMQIAKSLVYVGGGPQDADNP